MGPGPTDDSDAPAASRAGSETAGRLGTPILSEMRHVLDEAEGGIMPTAQQVALSRPLRPRALCLPPVSFSA